MLGYKREIKKAILGSGVKLSTDDVDKLTEAVDILFDTSVPNSIYNHIAYMERSGQINYMKTINDKYYEDFFKK